MKFNLLWICTLLSLALFVSCSHKRKHNHNKHHEMEKGNLVATLVPKSGSKVKGQVHFTRTEDGVTVHVTATGLTQNTEHGFHIHQYGDCSSDDATSAGDHFAGMNPTHGAPHSEAHHSGDLGNLKTNAQGKVDKTETYKFLKFYGPHSIIGRAVIIHEKADDLTSQPAGNAGKRIACGVIGIAK